jgi:hypothetical protein
MSATDIRYGRCGGRLVPWSNGGPMVVPAVCDCPERGLAHPSRIGEMCPMCRLVITDPATERQALLPFDRQPESPW